MHKLERYLIDKGLTQEAFALLIGSTQESVSRYISGLRTPRPAMMARITAVTQGEVTANDFVAAREDDEDDTASASARDAA